MNAFPTLKTNVLVAPLMKVFAGIVIVAELAFAPNLTVIVFLAFLPAFGARVITVPGFTNFNLTKVLAEILPDLGAVTLGT